MKIIIMIIGLLLYSFSMYLSGKNDGYYKGYNEALKEFNKRY